MGLCNLIHLIINIVLYPYEDKISLISCRCYNALNKIVTKETSKNIIQF